MTAELPVPYMIEAAQHAALIILLFDFLVRFLKTSLRLCRHKSLSEAINSVYQGDFYPLQNTLSRQIAKKLAR